jgi:hypothetical protein
MQTAKEYQEQLEWFWLLCQEEAWQEEDRWGEDMTPEEWDQWEAHW